MKILRHRNLLGCLFAILLSLPLLNVLARVLYTQWNKNAKDSYSFDKNLSEVLDITNTNNLIDGNTYYFSLLTNTQTQTTGVNTGLISYYDTNLFDVISQYQPIDETQYNQFSLGFLSGYWNYNTLALYKDNVMLKYYRIGQDNTNFINTEVLHNIWFIFKDKSTQQTTVVNEWHMYENVFGLSGTLDNAFEYSINKITDGNNIGEVKFFTWFADLFLDLDNPSNALYINFINWYFNYVILVSAVYILFLVLMWFINFIRKLLERGMDFGQRGY